MVVRANRKPGDLGGHIAVLLPPRCYMMLDSIIFSAASCKTHRRIQRIRRFGLFSRPFSARRLCARVFGGTNQRRANGKLRSEISGKGLSSYPHPWLMPDFWQFPTVSMGLGRLWRFIKRVLCVIGKSRLNTQNEPQSVGVHGDGEMDEPESLGAISLAAREGLDNLVFVVNCNLQRLDGPVRGNGKIIQELEAVFRGAGWNAIKIIWGSYWDTLLYQDKKACYNSAWRKSRRRLSNLSRQQRRLYS